MGRLRVALCIAASLALSACGESVAPSQPPPSVEGIEQTAFTLGAEDAPNVLSVYLDPFCVGTGCAAFDSETVSTLIGRYVRPGRLKIVLRPVTTPGYPESGVRETFAASLQGRGWQFVLAFLARGTRTIDPYEIARTVPGLDVGRLQRDARSPRVAAAVTRAAERRSERDADVPSAYFDPPGRGDSDLRRIRLRSGDALLRSIERLIASRQLERDDETS
jgi:hypothetical protein